MTKNLYKLLRSLTPATIKLLHTLPHLLTATPIRTMHYAPTNTHYFSAVDICHLLCNPIGTAQTPQSRQRAKNYWQSIKRRDPRFDIMLGASQFQLLLPDCNGRLRMTDVIDLPTVLYLIKKITHKHSRVFKLWLLFVGAKALLRWVMGWAVRWIARIVQCVRKKGRKLCLTVCRVGRSFEISARPPSPTSHAQPSAPVSPVG